MDIDVLVVPMHNTLIDAISHLQLCSAKLPGCHYRFQAESELIGGSAVLTTKLLILSFLVKHGKLGIAFLLQFLW